jgi:hypothetical protein
MSLCHNGQGAASTMWACLSPSVATTDRGAYIQDCHPTAPNANGEDADGKMRKALWNVTEEQIAEVVKKF